MEIDLAVILATVSFPPSWSLNPGPGTYLTFSCESARCPRPLMIRMHILVMEFIGSLGVPAPKLREADLDLQGWRACFNECFVLLRAMFHRKPTRAES